jgi:hypothetical protein
VVSREELGREEGVEEGVEKRERERNGGVSFLQKYWSTAELDKRINRSYAALRPPRQKPQQSAR